jgi:glycosyltransferase involved in cell wall biosynthesis
MPVHNGAGTLERALRSVQRQEFRQWELLAVDDGSTDGSFEILRRWADQDGRIRPVRLEENLGVGVARNRALRAARGKFVAYLDHDDEYYPEYFSYLARMAGSGDVLVFAYDIVTLDGSAEAAVRTWEPAMATIAVPLGVAHRRQWIEKVGGFNELLWWEEDTDLWRRLARAGASFAFVPVKSGRYYVYGDSRSRAPRLTRQQRETFEANRLAGRPLYGPSAPLPSGRQVRKIAFVSPHCVIDYTNGAATATLDGLEFVQSLGFVCGAFSCSRSDAWEEVLIEDVLAQRGVSCEVRNVRKGSYEGRLIATFHHKVPVTLFRTVSSRGGWTSAGEVEAFLTACEIFLENTRPDVVWTYGGDPVSCAVHQLVKRLDIPILFFLHNFAYLDSQMFYRVDYPVVPSEFSRRFYWDRLGMACQKLPLVVDPQRVQVAQRRPQYVTFVNPEPRKGVYLFARIAEELSRRRTDIPLLMVEGANKAHLLPQLGIDLSGIKNLTVMPNTPDSRAFLAVTKFLLMPSVMENVGLVAMEAMLNGIPVVASNRGALPETVGDAGFQFDIPARYTTESRLVPTAEEVSPWVETVIRLWDDQGYYERWSRAAQERSRLWHPDHLGPLYREFFSGLFPQPGPPLVPPGSKIPSRRADAEQNGASIITFSNREQMVLSFSHGAIVAEIGVDRGVFARSILRTSPKKLYLIDPWEKQQGDYAADPTNDENFEEKHAMVRDTLGRLPNVEIVRGYSLQAVERFSDGYFDWLYLDADHSYNAVASDLKAWIKKIKPGGVFAGHDYLTYRWIQVRPALDEFLRQTGRSLRYLTTDDVFLSWGFIV